METTHSRARVAAVLIHTGLVPWALRVDNALRLTFNVGVANVVPDAPTRGCTSPLTALCVSPTRGWVAGLNDLNWSWCCYKKGNNQMFAAGFKNLLVGL